MSGFPDPSLVRKLTDEYPQTRRILIAYSGGLDSRVLLHLACKATEALSVSLVAVHVDHGLHPESANWAHVCKGVCQQSGVPLTVLSADITPKKGHSLEAQARDARYALLKSQLDKNDLLLLAHHADDQAETVFLQLLRGAGPQGLAAMPRVKVFGPALVVRPLLECSRQNLEEYASEHSLQWIDDPSNGDHRFDRNFLRHEIFPQLQTRFPAFRETIARSARHNAEVSDWLQAEGAADLAKCLNPANNCLSLRQMRKLAMIRLKNLLRYWVCQSGYRVPQERQLKTLTDLIESPGPDRNCSLDAKSYRIRQYRGDLYLVAKPHKNKRFIHEWADLDQAMIIPELNLRLERKSLELAGLRLPDGAQIVVKSRNGGEKIRQGNPPRHRTLKNIFQENAVPQWCRDRYPLIYCDGQLVAIPGLAVDPDYNC